MLDKKFSLNKKFCLITGAAGLLGHEHAEAILEINGNLILFLCVTSFGDKILSSFLRKSFNSLLLKQRDDEMAPE